jgi:hypothetical protein
MITDLELVAVIPRAAKSLDGMPPAFKSLDPAFGKLLTTGACKLLTFACCCCELWISGGLSWNSVYSNMMLLLLQLRLCYCGADNGLLLHHEPSLTGAVDLPHLLLL